MLSTDEIKMIEAMNDPVYTKEYIEEWAEKEICPELDLDGALTSASVKGYKRAAGQMASYSCEPEYLGENIGIGCRDGKCKCGNIVRSYMHFCFECGRKLLWENAHG